MESLHLASLLKQYPLFDGITVKELEGLAEGHKFANLRHHEAWVKENTPAHHFAIVLSGAFKLVKSNPRGEDTIVFFASPGDVIAGLVMLRPNTIYPVTAVSLGLSTLLTIPRSTFIKSWAGNASLQIRLNSMLSSRMNAMHEEKVNAKLQLHQRVAGLLLSLLDRYTSPDGAKLPIPLTRQEIADSTGASVESVIRCMSKMQQEGILRTEDKQIVILRTDKIVEFIRAP